MVFRFNAVDLQLKIPPKLEVSSDWLLVQVHPEGSHVVFMRATIYDPVRLQGFFDATFHFILCDMTFVKQKESRKCQ